MAVNRYNSTGLTYEQFLALLRQELDSGRLTMSDLQEMYNEAGVKGTPERDAIVNLYNEQKQAQLSEYKTTQNNIKNAYFSKYPYHPSAQSSALLDSFESLQPSQFKFNENLQNQLYEEQQRQEIQQALQKEEEVKKQTQKNNTYDLFNTQINSPQNILEHMYMGNSSAKPSLPTTRTDAFGAVSNAAEPRSDNEFVRALEEQSSQGYVNLDTLQKAYEFVNTDNDLSQTQRDFITKKYNDAVSSGGFDPNVNNSKTDETTPISNEDIINKISNWNTSGRGTIEGKDYYNPYFDYEKVPIGDIVRSAAAGTLKDYPLQDLRVGFREGNGFLGFGKLTGWDRNNYSVDALRNTLNLYSPETAEFINSLTDAQLENILKENAATDTEDYAFNSFMYGDRKYIDLQSAITDLQQLAQVGDMPTRRSREEIVDEIYSGNNAEVNRYLEDLQKETDRNTELMQQQLNENQLAFDDYRSNILSNQYQQNAQLMGQVGSEMSKARRNALEAGASAGLRMAENINTTLAMQNKQSQLSLETSNQLAQQLLNQRQASSGIRSNYNQMLNNNASEARQYKANAVDKFDSLEQSRYNDAYDKWSSQMDSVNNQFGDDYRAYKTNKTNSVYN